ncbi:MAG: hypothetical protein JW725_01335 [Candidatus Babeliaceae bacterium]|nr:hypothetical protein [Candidatus Babeliaceae bacterium]
MKKLFRSLLLLGILSAQTARPAGQIPVENIVSWGYDAATLLGGVVGYSLATPVPLMERKFWAWTSMLSVFCVARVGLQGYLLNRVQKTKGVPTVDFWLRFSNVARLLGLTYLPGAMALGHSVSLIKGLAQRSPTKPLIWDLIIMLVTGTIAGGVEVVKRVT